MDVLGAQPEEEIRPRQGEGRPDTGGAAPRLGTDGGTRKETAEWDELSSTINQEWQTQQTGRGGQALLDFHLSQKEKEMP